MKRSLTSLFTLWIASTAGIAWAAATTLPAPQERRSEARDPMARMTKDLGLSKKQSESISAIMAKTRDQMRKLYASKESDDSKQKKMLAIHSDAQKKIMTVLNPEQRKKFEQMRQSPRAGNSAGRGTGFANHVRSVLRDLKLSKTQQAKTDSALKDFEKQAAVIKSDTKFPPDQRRAKMDTLRKATTAKVNSALTAEQQKKFKERMPQFFVRPGGPKK